MAENGNEQENTATPDSQSAELDIGALKAALEQATAKASENWDHYVRAQAEMQNLKRRSERDLEQAHKYGLEKFAGELLPVMDSLELGYAAARDGGNAAEKLLEGTELTLRMFRQVLEKFNLKTLDPAGEPFNPELHQAISVQESATAQPNTVLHVVQKGYLLSDRLMRPALVVVARAAQQASSVDERA